MLTQPASLAWLPADRHVMLVLELLLHTDPPPRSRGGPAGGNAVPNAAELADAPGTTVLGWTAVAPFTWQAGSLQPAVASGQHQVRSGRAVPLRLVTGAVFHHTPHISNCCSECQASTRLIDKSQSLGSHPLPSNPRRQRCAAVPAAGCAPALCWIGGACWSAQTGSARHPPSHSAWRRHLDRRFGRRPPPPYRCKPHCRPPSHRLAARSSTHSCQRRHLGLRRL